jgi:hypothetical protein
MHAAEAAFEMAVAFLETEAADYRQAGYEFATKNPDRGLRFLAHASALDLAAYMMRSKFLR